MLALQYFFFVLGAQPPPLRWCWDSGWLCVPPGKAGGKLLQLSRAARGKLRWSFPPGCFWAKAQV